MNKMNMDAIGCLFSGRRPGKPWRSETLRQAGGPQFDEIEEWTTWTPGANGGDFPVYSKSGVHYLETDESGSVGTTSVMLFDSEFELLWSTCFGNAAGSKSLCIDSQNDHLFIGGRSIAETINPTIPPWTLWEYCIEDSEDCDSSVDWFQSNLIIPIGTTQWSPAIDAIIAKFRIPEIIETSQQKVENEIIEIKVYPNPSYDSFQISIRGGEIQNSSLEIVDMTGKLKKKWSSQWNLSKTEFYIGDLSDGIYFVRLIAGNEVHSYKLIKLTNK